MCVVVIEVYESVVSLKHAKTHAAARNVRPLYAMAIYSYNNRDFRCLGFGFRISSNPA